MQAQFDLLIHRLEPRRPFRIARARTTPLENVLLRLRSDGCTGYGEASPNPFYGEDPHSVCEKIRAAVPRLQSLAIESPADIGHAWEALWPLLSPSRAAQCAIDVALWDWLARRRNTSLSNLLWNADPRPIPSFCTLGLSTPEELPSKLAELAGLPQIKVKLDAQTDLALLTHIRAQHPQALIAVDANASWTSQQILAAAPQLQHLSIAFLEQPLPPGTPLPALASLPQGPMLMADESVVTEEDLPRIAPQFGGFNIKLVKCGGITPALRMLAHAKSTGLRTMVGCMLETSLLIAAGAAVAQGADYADLDGAWLLRNDPFDGWLWKHGFLHPPTAPPPFPTHGTSVAIGTGAHPNPGIFST